MMAIRNVEIDGVLRESWDDDTRFVTMRDASGVILPDYPRAYTPEENAIIDARIAEANAKTAREAQRTLVKAIVTDLQLEKDRVQPTIDATKATINADPGAYIKDVARAAKRIADANIDLAKFVKDML